MVKRAWRRVVPALPFAATAVLLGVGGLMIRGDHDDRTVGLIVFGSAVALLSSLIVEASRSAQAAAADRARDRDETRRVGFILLRDWRDDQHPNSETAATVVNSLLNHGKGTSRVPDEDERIHLTGWILKRRLMDAKTREIIERGLERVDAEEST